MCLDGMWNRFTRQAQQVADETRRRAEEEAQRARRFAEEQARKVAEEAEQAKRLAEEQARKVAEETQRKAEEAKRLAEEQARKVAEETQRKAEEARQLAEQVLSTNHTQESFSVYNGIRDYSLCHVAFQSSHNSYLKGIQHLSCSSVDAIRDIIRRGYRCIELDVFNGIGEVPVVAHGVENETMNLYTTTPISFYDCLEAIRQEAFVSTEEPLLVVIENNTNHSVECNNTMARSIQEVLHPWLFRGRITTATKVGDIWNRVIILTGGGNVGEMVQMVNGQWGEDGLHNMSSNGSVEEIKPDGLTRVYPRESLVGVFSGNENMMPFVNRGANLVALNAQTNDSACQEVRQWFGQYRIRPLSL